MVGWEIGYLLRSDAPAASLPPPLKLSLQGHRAGSVAIALQTSPVSLFTATPPSGKRSFISQGPVPNMTAVALATNRTSG